VTLCDPIAIQHVSPIAVRLAANYYTPFTYLLTYLQSWQNVLKPLHKTTQQLRLFSAVKLLQCQHFVGCIVYAALAGYALVRIERVFHKDLVFRT